MNCRGRHTTVRAHRLLGTNRMDMRLGPIAFDVVRPFQEWRLALDDNEHAISFHISWLDTKRAQYRNIGAQAIITGRVFEGVAGYEGFGAQDGWVRVGEETFTLSAGEEKHLTFERLGNQVAFLRCGMYGGPNGGTLDGDIWQGMYVGDDVVSGETYDVNDPGVRTHICGVDQLQCRVECDEEIVTGLIEVYDTLVHETAVAGRRGLSVLE